VPASEPAIIAAARHFVAIMTDDAPPSEPALAQALDRIALASHDMPSARSYSRRRVREALDELGVLGGDLSRRFPDLGFYAVIGPLEEIYTSSYAGDAIDDLGDILRDMDEAVWRYEHYGADDASMFLRARQTQWGRHLRQLSLYLEARRDR
jgi:hypothetical protein